MKKILMFVLSALMLCAFAFPVYANSNNQDLTAEEINRAFLTYAPGTIEFAMSHSSDYGLPEDCSDLFFGTPFYLYNPTDDASGTVMNKETICFPVVSEEKVVAILTIGKTDGSLFCNFSQSFSEVLNESGDDPYIIIGDGNSLWTEKISNEQATSPTYTDEKMSIDFQSSISENSLPITCLNIIDSKKILTPVIQLTDLLNNAKNTDATGEPLSGFQKLRELLIHLALQQVF